MAVFHFNVTRPNKPPTTVQVGHESAYKALLHLLEQLAHGHWPKDTTFEHIVPTTTEGATPVVSAVTAPVDVVPVVPVVEPALVIAPVEPPAVEPALQ